MKKILLSVTLTAITALAFGQACVPGPFPDPGIYTDTLSSTDDSQTLYNEVITVVIPVDTNISDLDTTGLLDPICGIQNFILDSVKGLPPGFIASCNPATCVFPGGTSSCLAIIGDPSAAGAGTYPLTAYVTANLDCTIAGIIPVDLAVVDSITDYFVEIESTACDNSVPPQNPTSTQLPSGGYELTWDPVPNSVGCQVQLTLPTGGTVSQNVLAPEASSFTAPAGPLSSFTGQDISWKVRCACQISPTIIATGFSAVDVFTVGSPRLGDASISDVSLYTNPANDMINVISNTEFTGEVTVSIYDIVGRRVANYNTAVVSGSNTLSYDISKLSPGTYVVEMLNGTEKLVQKFNKAE
jgi:hypothetical protein